MKKALALTSAAALVLCGLAGSTANATPGSGTAVTNEVLGTLAGPTKARQDGVTLKTREDTTVRSFTLTYAPGGFSGWHYHPGIVIATVKSGSVVQRVGCKKPRTYTVGDSFTEVDPHFVSNPGTEDAVLAITQIFPTDAVAREDIDAPQCGKRRS